MPYYTYEIALIKLDIKQLIGVIVTYIKYV
jgi:hypothetical protein